GVGISRAVVVLDHEAAPCPVVGQALHQRRLSGARAALEDDDPLGFFVRQDVVVVREKTLRRVASRKKVTHAVHVPTPLPARACAAPLKPTSPRLKAFPSSVLAAPGYAALGRSVPFALPQRRKNLAIV